MNGRSRLWIVVSLLASFWGSSPAPAHAEDCMPFDFECHRRNAPRPPGFPFPKPGRFKQVAIEKLKALLTRVVGAIRRGERSAVKRALEAIRVLLGPPGRAAAAALQPLATLRARGKFADRAPACVSRTKSLTRAALETFRNCLVAAAEVLAGPKTDTALALDLGRFALRSYFFAKGDNEATGSIPDGFVELLRSPGKGSSKARDPQTGFRAIAFARGERPGGDVVIAYTGSMSEVDWEVNSALVALVHAWPVSRARYDAVAKRLRNARWSLAAAGWNFERPQKPKRGGRAGRAERNLALLALRIKQSQDFFDTVRKMRPKHSQLWVTGHSLGGFMAEMIGVRNRHVVSATHTFNAAPGGWHLLGAPSRIDRVTHHRRLADVVSIEPTHVGTVCTYPSPKKGNIGGVDTPPLILAQHSMEGFVAALERCAKPLRCGGPRPRPK